MSELRKAIIIETGMNNVGLQSGISSMTTQIKALANEIKAGLMPVSMPPEVAAYYAKLGKTSGEAFAAAQAKALDISTAANQAAIARGFTPANMAGGNALKSAENNFGQGAEIVAGGYIFNKAGKLMGKMGADGQIAKIAGEAAVAGVEEGVGTQAKVEVAVLIRETLRGAGVSRIIASAMRLTSLIFDAALYYIGIAMVTVGLVDEILPRAWGGTTISGWWKSRSAAKSGAADLKQNQKSDAEMLRSRIKMMQEHGLISDSRARGLTSGLAGESQEGLIAAFNATNPLMGKLKGQQVSDFEMKAERAGLTTGQSKYTFDLLQQHLLLEKIVTLKKGSVAYDETLKKIKQNSLDLEKDKAEMVSDAAKKKKDDDAAAQKAAEKLNAENQKKIDLTNQLHENERSQNEVLRQYQQEDTRGIPSLEEAAGGGGFLTRLRNWYGRANKRGVQGMARDYVRQQYGMGFDFEQYALANPGKNYGDWLLTSPGKGEKNYLNQLAGPLQAMGLVKNDDLGGKLDDLKTINQNIHDKLSHVGLESN